MNRFFALFLLTSLAIGAGHEPFRAEPYLQMGDNPSRPNELTLLWQTDDQGADWSVDVKSAGSSKWKPMEKPAFQRVAIRGIAPHRVYRVTLVKLKPGEEFDYRVSMAGADLFSAHARARKSKGQDYRFVVFGDCAQNTLPQRRVAYQT